MDWTSAPIIEDAPLEPAHRRFLPAWISAISGQVETFLERERAQLPLWFAVAFGVGIAAWLWLPGSGNGLRLSLLTKACADADIVVADRRLPRGCIPRWLKLDREALEHTGGVAIYLGEKPKVASVAARLGEHPWR